MKKHKILIIDDNPCIRALLRYALKSDYNIIEAKTAEQGLILIRNLKPSLIITDHQTPGRITGLEMAQLLREEQNPIPIIMFSASIIEEDVKHYVNSFFPKPFSIIDLIKSIRKNLSNN
ncbi:response regulator [Candidatus Margulisiibacteriota bacterium]